MADKALGMLLYYIHERSHLIDNGNPRLSALLNGRNDNLLYPILSHLLSFRELAKRKRELIHTYLGGFLHHPLHTLHHLRRRHSDMEMSFPSFLLRKFFCDAIVTMLPLGKSDLCLEEHALTIHEEYLIALNESQHADGVLCLFLRKFICLPSLWHIEISHFLHSFALLSSSSLICFAVSYSSFSIAFSSDASSISFVRELIGIATPGCPFFKGTL